MNELELGVGMRIEKNAIDFKQGPFLRYLGGKLEHKNMKLFFSEKAILFKAEATQITELKIEASWIDKLGLGSEKHLYIVKN